MKTYYNSDISAKEIYNLTQRKSVNLNSIINETVKPIFNDIEKRGDEALMYYTNKFDGVQIKNFKISDKEFKEGARKITSEFKKSADLAYKNIYKFHNSQIFKEKEIETMPGIKCFRQNRAIEKIALYIPGGTAPLFSTVLMLGIPAKIAGCKNIILLTPPNKEGKINNEILYCAKKCGIENIFKIGGAQGIGAVSIGTKTFPKVDKIFGPGNSFVTGAKILAQSEYGIAIDMPAGPSEVLVIGDKNSDPRFIASDLLSQAEHGSDSQSILVLIGDNNLDEIKYEINKQLDVLPRKNIARKSLENSFIIVVNNINEAFGFSNKYAPEHLIINLKNPRKYINKIQNAGSVFLGEYSPESAGDYASGTNHTLPTSGYAKNYSGISIDSFIKKITFQELSKKGLEKIGKAIEIMAEKEGLQAHKNAITVRLGKK